MSVAKTTEFMLPRPPRHYGQTMHDRQADPGNLTQPAKSPILSASSMVKDYPELRQVIIDPLLRESEVANIIAASKIGKTHLAIDLAISMTVGGLWLGRFPIARGRALYLDAELHRETFASRLASIASARKISVSDLKSLDVLPLRGNLRSLEELSVQIQSLPRKTYRLIIVDALYRLTPEQFDENNNRHVTQLYNLEDQIAHNTGAAIVNIHHASKGAQAGKGVTDVGSGAGAQSRAVDTHIILRPHQQENCVVLEAALRSFAPLPPVALRWTYPTWNIDPTLDPTLLLDAGRRGKKAKPIPRRWTLFQFADQFLSPDPQTKATIMVAADVLGISERKAGQLLDASLDAGLSHEWDYGPKKPHRFATVKQPADIQKD